MLVILSYTLGGEHGGVSKLHIYVYSWLMEIEQIGSVCDQIYEQFIYFSK